MTIPTIARTERVIAAERHHRTTIRSRSDDMIVHASAVAWYYLMHRYPRSTVWVMAVAGVETFWRLSR